MVSVEEEGEIYKRQRFHQPCGSPNLALKKAQFKSFLSSYEPKGKKSIFWLDYTGLEYGLFEDFMMLLGKVALNSMIKITLRSQPSDHLHRAAEFRDKFGVLMPDRSAEPPRVLGGLAHLIQQMVRIASQVALPSAMPLMFLPVSSFYYSDGTGMFTLTGMVCLRNQENIVRSAFSGW